MEETKKLLSPEEMAKQADELFIQEMKDGKYMSLLTTMDTLGRYTLRNQMLILSQKPNATNVNSMTGWNYQKRSIIPGEKSLKILAPTFAKKVTMGTDGSVTEETLDKVTGYEVRFVFDVKQTKGDAVRDIVDSEIAIMQDNLLTDALKSTAKDFTFGTSAELEEGTDALLDTDSKTITLREGLPKNKELKTLINQVAAANILMRSRQHFRGLSAYEMKNITGVEISGATYVVAKRLGLEAAAVEPDFKDMDEEKIGKFAENVGVIRSVSQRMISSMENANETEKAAMAAAEKAAEETKIINADKAANQAEPQAKVQKNRAAKTKNAEAAM